MFAESVLLGQFGHALAPEAEYVPAAHEPLSAARPDDAQKLPAGQLLQLEVPVLGWYWPTGQLAQATAAWRAW